MTRLSQIRQILWWVLFLNFLVALAKWGYGMITQSLSMQADGVHSFFDGLSNVVGLIGIYLATPPPDEHHPYGHKKFEALASASIGSFLVLTCLYLLYKAYSSWTLAIHPKITNLSFAVMVITMIINLVISKWEGQKGRELNSEILTADSYHTGSDVLVSVSVLAGFFAIQAGYPFIDPLVAILIAGVIAWTAFIVLKDVLASLTDQIRIEAKDIRTAVMSIPEILDCHDIRTRGLAHHVFVDLSIHLNPSWSVQQGHQIATKVEQALRQKFKAIEDVVIHMEPEGHHGSSTTDLP